MNRIRAAIFVAFLAIPCLSHAETVELVTYFPTSSNNSFDRFHADRGTVGNPYSLSNPADPLPSGVLLIAGPLGIGTDFSAVSLPATALQIMTGQGIRVRQGLPIDGFFDGTGYELYRDGVERMHLYYNTTQNWVELNTGATPNASLIFVNNNGQVRMFLDGASGNIGIGTMAPVFPLEVVRNQNATVVAGGFSNTSAGNAGVTDLRVGQDVETNNGQYGALNYYGSGTPANFQGYGNPNQVSLVAAFRAVNGLSIATNANAPIKFLTNSNGVNNERMRITGAGNVGIGTNAPNPAAALELSFTTNNPAGFLPPRMTTGQRNSIAAPPEGLTIYNTTTHQAEVRTNTAWMPVGLPTFSTFVFAQGNGVVSGTNNAINETATFTISLPAGTWVVQAHAQIDQSSTPALSFRINGVEVQATPDSGSGRDLVVVFGVRQITVAGPGPSVIPVTLVATTNQGLKENSAPNFMIIATQVG